MPHRRLLAKFTFIAVGSSLVGCSGTGFTPGNRDDIAGAAGRNATQAGAAAINAGTAGTSLGGTRATIASGTSGNPNLAGGAASTSISGGGTALGIGGGGTALGIGGGGTALGIGGSTSVTNVALGGVAGSVNVIPGCETVTCTPSSNPCQEAVCRNGGCVLVNVDSGRPCETSGVCSGTGFCGACVPSRGKCDNNVPSVCSAEGAWVAGSACGLGDECVAGACIAPRVGWALSANGDANAEIEDLAFLSTDSIIAAVHAESGTVNVGTNVLNAESRAHNNAVFGMSRATGGVAWNLTLKSTDWAWGARIGVASDTSFVHAFRYMGSIDIYTNPNTYDYGAFIRGYNAARAVQFTELFNPIDNTVGPQVEGIDAIIAQPNGSFLLFTYSKGLVYSIRDNPGQATMQETSEECATVLSRLNPYGIPVWNKQFAWCTDNNHKVMKLGPTGDLYVGGSASTLNGFGPVPILDATTLKSNQSGVLARLRATDGAVVKVVEFEGISSSYGRVNDLAFLPDGSLIALVSAANYMTFKIGTTEVPGGTYLVKLDADLNLVKYQYVGSPISANAYVTDGRLAAAPNGTLYVAGTFVGDFDFGGGTFTNVSSCDRCLLGDAFVASYTSDFEHRWSRAMGSAMFDKANAILAENGRAYVSVSYGATIVVDGKPYAPPTPPMIASTLFAFVE